MLITRRRHLYSLATGILATRSGSAANGLFQAVDITHVTLVVANLARSRDFYRRMLGVRVLEESDHSCVVGLQKNYLTFIKGDHSGMRYYSVAISDFSEKQALTKLRSAGLKIEELAHGTQTVADPDSLRLQLASADERQDQINAAFKADAKPGSIFRAIDINHLAIRVTDINRSKEFYQNLLGLKLLSQDSGSCFLGMDGDFLTLFRGDAGRLDHFCLSVEGYQVDDAVRKLAANGQKPTRTENRVYFPDPDGLTVQLAELGHGA